MRVRYSYVIKNSSKTKWDFNMGIEHIIPTIYIGNYTDCLYFVNPNCFYIY